MIDRILKAQNEFMKIQCKNNKAYRQLHIKDLTENLRQLQEIKMVDMLDELNNKEKFETVLQIVDYYEAYLIDKIIELSDDDQSDK